MIFMDEHTTHKQMKKVLTILGCITLGLASCGSPDSSTKSSDADKTSGAESSSTASPGASGNTDAGKQLIAKSDCLGCHNETQKVVGPAYVDVAAKYTESDLDYLSGKIINGGSGVWGEVPMTAHPSLSKDDATQMARYILSLKK
jgi:cytochrome c